MIATILIIFSLLLIGVVIFVILNDRNSKRKGIKRKFELFEKLHSAIVQDVTNKIKETMVNTHSSIQPEKLPSLNLSGRFNNLPIYYINLDRSIDRRKNIEKQITLFSIPNVTRVPAVDGKLLESLIEGVYPHPWGDIRYSLARYTKQKYNMGVLGCLLSHFVAIKKAYENGNDLAIIIEDDLSFYLLPYWPIESVKTVMDNAPPDWKILSLMSTLCHSEKGYVSYREKPCLSTACYIINRKGMENVLRGDKSFIVDDDWELPADHLIYYRAKNMYSYVENLLFYVYNNNLFRSTITDGNLDYMITSSLNILNHYKSFVDL